MKTRILLAIALILSCGSSQKAVQTPPPAPENARIATPSRPQPAPASRPYISAQDADEWEARWLETLYFDYDRADLRGDQLPTLIRNADKLRSNGLLVQIEGHCDERGAGDYSLALGMKRAENARSFMLKTGIDPRRLSAISYGEDRPADPGHNESAWAQKRRAVCVTSEP